MKKRIALLTTVASDDSDLQTFVCEDEFPENIAAYSLAVNVILGADYYNGEFQL